MAPFRKRSSLAKTARNAAIAEAALALARHRLNPKGDKRRRGPSTKVLALGGVVVAAGALAYFKRDRVAGLLPSHSESAAPEPPAPPAPSNYDAPGPVANTATPVPAPEPQVHPAGLDEAAEEAAAAAEAANIGGAPTEYVGPAGEPAREAERPLAEAGQGEAEGQEQAEADLAENAILRDAGTTGAQEQLGEAIEAQHDPLAGETVEPIVSEEPAPEPAPPTQQQPAEPPAPAAEDQPSPPGEEDSWKTWSGRSVDS